MRLLLSLFPLIKGATPRRRRSSELRQLLLLALALWLLTPAASASDLSSSYRLGPEDAITVTVMRHSELSGEFLLPADGIVTLPSAGAIKAAGMTMDELAAEATKRLKDRLKNPEVTVALRAPRMQRIYVLGEVKAPGQYDLKPGWRITEALAAAGGLTPQTEPADCQALISRGTTGNKEQRNLGAVMRGDDGANLLLQSGDVLTIDSGETLPVYIAGRVREPGLYRIRKSEAGVMEALTVAGGTTDDAALSEIRVTHVSGVAETVDISAAGSEASQMKLQAGDLVLVPETKARIAILGHVSQPGFYSLKDGQTLTLSDALGLARGVDKRGEMRSVAIIRSENGKQSNTVFDMNRFLKKGDLSQNPEVRPGDVVYIAETRKPDWEGILRSASAVSLLINPFVR